jgi:hypothetical protein
MTIFFFALDFEVGSAGCWEYGWDQRAGAIFPSQNDIADDAIVVSVPFDSHDGAERSMRVSGDAGLFVEPPPLVF